MRKYNAYFKIEYNKSAETENIKPINDELLDVFQNAKADFDYQYRDIRLTDKDYPQYCPIEQNPTYQKDIIYLAMSKPFGLSTNPQCITKEPQNNYIKIYAYPENGYIPINQILKNTEIVSKYKICSAKAYGERGSFPYSVIGKPFIIEPNSCCSETYLVLFSCDDKKTANNVVSYIKTRFVRFLILLQKNTQDAPKRVYEFVPMQDFSKPWTDAELYTKYKLTREEIDFIESMIRPME